MSKRVLAIHDLSAFGHSSLMAAIPIFYRLGFRVCALPTAIMSANTLYPDPLTVDFSPHLLPFVNYWKGQGLKFDAIYSGFLAGPEQAELVEEVIGSLRGRDTLVLVDPVMADQGKLYSCYDERMVEAMRSLVAHADIITPNYTEAALLLGRDYDPRGGAGLELWCRELAGLGPKEVVVTSVPAGADDLLHTVCFDGKEYKSFRFVRKDGVFPGAGDVFASFLLAGVLNGLGTGAATEAAVGMVTKAILTQAEEDGDWREGIALEGLLQFDLTQFLPESWQDRQQ
jgi:pyridoxine kinase